MIIDSFAGGGGASTGIEMAGYHVDIAINHDPAAIAMHRANHPTTKHYCENIWAVDPREAFNAQGFPKDYIIDVDADGNPYPKSEQMARCGNAVCPSVAAALVKANHPNAMRAECEG